MSAHNQRSGTFVTNSCLHQPTQDTPNIRGFLRIRALVFCITFICIAAPKQTCHNQHVIVVQRWQILGSERHVRHDASVRELFSDPEGSRGTEADAQHGGVATQLGLVVAVPSCRMGDRQCAQPRVCIYITNLHSVRRCRTSSHTEPFDGPGHKHLVEHTQSPRNASPRDAFRPNALAQFMNGSSISGTGWAR